MWGVGGGVSLPSIRLSCRRLCGMPAHCWDCHCRLWCTSELVQAEMFELLNNFFWSLLCCVVFYPLLLFLSREGAGWWGGGVGASSISLYLNCQPPPPPHKKIFPYLRCTLSHFCFIVLLICSIPYLLTFFKNAILYLNSAVPVILFIYPLSDSYSCFI